jgi:hypothetical protein
MGINPSFLLGWNTEKTGSGSWRKPVVEYEKHPGFTPITMNKRLRVISGREQLILRPTDGNDTLARATDVFSYIDSNFKNWACDVEGQGTEV